MKLNPRLTAEGVVLVKRIERLRRRAEPRPGGGWVVGYGHVASAREGAEVGEADADALLVYDLSRSADRVAALLRTPVDAARFDALNAVAFRMAPEAFARSEVLRRMNAGEGLAPGEILAAREPAGPAVLAAAEALRARLDRLLLDPVEDEASSALPAAESPMPPAEPEPEPPPTAPGTQVELSLESRPSLDADSASAPEPALEPEPEPDFDIEPEPPPFLAGRTPPEPDAEPVVASAELAPLETPLPPEPPSSPTAETPLPPEPAPPPAPEPARDPEAAFVADTEPSEPRSPFGRAQPSAVSEDDAPAVASLPAPAPRAPIVSFERGGRVSGWRRARLDPRLYAAVGACGAVMFACAIIGFALGRPTGTGLMVGLGGVLCLAVAAAFFLYRWLGRDFVGPARP